LKLVLGFATSVLLSASMAFADQGYGHVEFANSGAPAAQADFLEGLAMLHDFEYESAAAAFRRAQRADPGFAMAYWGEAMTYNHPVWMEQDLPAARAVLQRLAPSAAARRAKARSEREQQYLDALEILYGEGSKQQRDLAYEQAMAKLHARYPDDLDATAFYGLSILGSANSGRDVATYMRAAAVLEEAWMDHREHPGLVHYLIHCYDDPAHAPLGLRAARRYAKIAPAAAHALHMTSHIFLALGMWPEVVEANVAAMAAVDRDRLANGGPVYRCGHSPSWLGYAYLQLGQWDKARDALSQCRASVDAHEADERAGPSLDPDDSLAGSFANMRLRYLLETAEWSGEVAAWPLPRAAGPGARLDYAFASAIGAIALHPGDGAQAALRQLDTVGREVAQIETQQHDPDPTNRVRPQILLLEARGLLAEAQKDRTGAERLLRQAVALEDKLPIAFGPPVIDKPTHELLAEFLLRHGRTAEAHREFEQALTRTPGRRAVERGLKSSAAGA
jgi:tetratricopeptide (TPR) repeat protein